MSLNQDQLPNESATEIIRALLADLRSPFPREVLAVASLRMGGTSVERAEAYLAAHPLKEPSDV